MKGSAWWMLFGPSLSLMSCSEKFPTGEIPPLTPAGAADELHVRYWTRNLTRVKSLVQLAALRVESGSGRMREVLILRFPDEAATVNDQLPPSQVDNPEFASCQGCRSRDLHQTSLQNNPPPVTIDLFILNTLGRYLVQLSSRDERRVCSSTLQKTH